MPLAKTTYDIPAEAPRSVLREDGIEFGFQLFYSTQNPVSLWFFAKSKGRDTLRRVPNFVASAIRTRSSASLPFRDRLEVENQFALAA